MDVPLSAPIKAVFFDIDGTLLDKNGAYTAELKEQIARVRALGIKTGIASGRPMFAAQFLIDELNLVDPGVFCTGAYVYSPCSNEPIARHPLRKDDAQSLLEHLRQLGLYYELYTLDAFYYETGFGTDIRRVHAQHLRCQPVRANLVDVAMEEPVFKFIVGVNSIEGRRSLRTLEQQLPQLHFAYASLPGYPEWCFANVIDSNACKRQAFARLLEYHQLSSDNVASFGDSHSDKVFLELAGVGVAMGNAPEDVQEVARFITKAAWEDGAAYALSRLIQ